MLSLHVALADPLRPFFKRPPAEFAQLNELLAPARCFLESLRRRCFHASLALDPSGLYGFLLDTTSTWSAVLDAPTAPPAMPPLRILRVRSICSAPSRSPGSPSAPSRNKRSPCCAPTRGPRRGLL